VRGRAPGERSFDDGPGALPVGQQVHSGCRAAELGVAAAPHGCPPSLLRKSVKRERRLPARCASVMAIGCRREQPPAQASVDLKSSARSARRR
jgi:hypothetical protein